MANVDIELLTKQEARKVINHLHSMIEQTPYIISFRVFVIDNYTGRVRIGTVGDWIKFLSPTEAVFELALGEYADCAAELYLNGRKNQRLTVDEIKQSLLSALEKIG